MLTGIVRNKLESFKEIAFISGQVDADLAPAVLDSLNECQIIDRFEKTKKKL